MAVRMPVVWISSGCRFRLKSRGNKNILPPYRPVQYIASQVSPWTRETIGNHSTTMKAPRTKSHEPCIIDTANCFPCSEFIESESDAQTAPPRCRYVLRTKSDYLVMLEKALLLKAAYDIITVPLVMLIMVCDVQQAPIRNIPQYRLHRSPTSSWYTPRFQ